MATLGSLFNTKLGAFPSMLVDDCASTYPGMLQAKLAKHVQMNVLGNQ